MTRPHGDHSDVVSEEVIAHARRNRYEGVGCSEAPRGTLFHHYKVKGGGIGGHNTDFPTQ